MLELDTKWGTRMKKRSRESEGSLYTSEEREGSCCGWFTSGNTENGMAGSRTDACFLRRDGTGRLAASIYMPHIIHVQREVRLCELEITTFPREQRNRTVVEGKGNNSQHRFRA